MQENKSVGNPISRLPVNLTQFIRSTSSISTIAQCTEELVQNALDSGSSCIAVRVDMSQLKVQVIDNGEGISRTDMEKIGSRFMTSKCRSLEDLEKGGISKYGYRGEALANIREMASILQIVSKKRTDKETWTVLFARGRRKPVKLFYENRQCIGTTVTVVDFMYNLPVRRRFMNPTMDLQDILQSVIALTLANPSTSFTLKNESNGRKMLQTSRHTSSKLGFQAIFGQEWKDSLIEIKKKLGKLTMHGFIGKIGSTNTDKQFIYVNNRLVRSSKLSKIITTHYKKSIICRHIPTSNNKERAAQNYYDGSPSKYNKLYPIFCIRIELPFFEFDISFGPRKNEVEFQDWGNITNFISSSLDEFLLENNLMPPSKMLASKEQQSHEDNANRVLKQFSMSGIEPLEATTDIESTSHLKETTFTEFTEEHTKQYLPNKHSTHKFIGTDELDGARHCLPVYRPSKIIHDEISCPKSHIRTQFPCSSTPNTSFHSGYSAKTVPEFFRQSKDSYYIDKKGIFKKSAKKNIIKNMGLWKIRLDSFI